MMAAIVVLILCLLPVCVLAGYPLYAWLKSVFFHKRIIYSDDTVQPVSIIIACKDEELYIRAKLDSFLAPENWIEGSEIIVVSNGSMDGTNAILQQYAHHPHVQVIIWEHRSSKIISVNHAMKLVKNGIIVFSDCRQTMKPGSVKCLVRNFADPSVGTVTSVLDNSGGRKRLTIRNLLNFIADCESRSGSSLNVFGALYAQRRTVFREFPANLLFDDLFVVVSTLLQDKRIIAEREAVICDVDFETYYQSNRIQRLARGLMIFLTQQYAMIRKLPAKFYLRFMIFKYLKLLLPFILLALIADALWLTYVHHLQGALLFVAGLICALCVYTPIRKLVAHLVSINFNFMMAVLRFVFFNERSNTWDKLHVIKSPDP